MSRTNLLHIAKSSLKVYAVHNPIYDTFKTRILAKRYETDLFEHSSTETFHNLRDPIICIYVVWIAKSPESYELRSQVKIAGGRIGAPMGGDRYESNTRSIRTVIFPNTERERYLSWTVLERR